ncbi:MAG: hypothetical protein KF774_18290 [Planctomyces sp.]|nr:hypothetical protein [Planctomyces sp.]
MSVATEQTTKHFVDLWARETILRRRRIVIEAPAGWDASRLADLDGEELSRLADEYGCDADWEIEETENWDTSNGIDVSGPVADDITPDIVFKMNKFGELIDVESGEPAAFTM